MYIDRPSSELQAVLLTELLNNRSKDIFVRSKPQSNKKTCYLINALELIDPTSKKLQVIILVPTAELALFITESARRMAKYSPSIRIDYITNDSFLRRDVNMLISTSGSLLKCIEEVADFDRNSVKSLIVDELELQVSSEENLRKFNKLASYLKGTNCQFQLFSNCFGEFGMQFVQTYITKNLAVFDFLRADSFDEFYQFYVNCDYRMDKYKSLVKLLRNVDADKVIVYVARISKAFDLCEDLRMEGFRNVLSLTSKTAVEKRLQVNNEFNSSKHAILVLNYPLLLGIGLSDVSMVINLNVVKGRSRNMYHEYIHKICKCSKPKKPGFIVNLVDAEEREYLNDLEKFFRFKIAKLDIGSLRWRDINNPDYN